ncbi:thioesterase family protein [Amorphus orientalis]|uniref:Acyl-CoA thioester hydrolase n=1 Tax=Amorphus orientalis TaxID=649198 RepID=A0AAE3VNL1_9HYPH|nr:thioesterase family protein [Amorphus orientalis]MDQ0315275.1 acyl-CoA thioester hydrolase [Amorphus orientalis]
MALIDVPAPLVAPDASVEEAWIDYNGHMNVAYYIVLFDRGTDHAFDHLDIGGAYRAREGCSFFTVESRTSYVRELTLGDSVTTSMQIIDHDDKRLHTFQEMHHATDGFLAATLETLFLHIDMDARKAVPWSGDVDERIRAAVSAHRALPRPERLGRAIGIPR